MLPAKPQARFNGATISDANLESGARSPCSSGMYVFSQLQKGSGGGDQKGEAPTIGVQLPTYTVGRKALYESPTGNQLIIFSK